MSAIQDLINRSLKEGEVLHLVTLSSMANAARIELAKKDAVIEAAREINEWLIRNNLSDTAHQRHLEQTLQEHDK